MVTSDQVKSALKELHTAKQSTVKNISILLLTIFMFFSFGLFEASISGIAVLVTVLIVHELGHLLAMKTFGYRDVKMFFIPLLGAAVSGKEVNPSGAKKAIVSLMGPVPGIVVGIVCAFIYFKTKNEILSECARTFLFINGFNLLPFYPLDGGRFFEAVLFSRNPKIEILFKVFTSLALVATAFYLKAIFLGVFAFFVLISLRGAHISATTAQKIRAELAEELSEIPESIPDPQLETITNALNERLGSSNDNPNLFAKYAESIWQKVCSKPARIGTTIILIVFYFIILPIGVAAPFVFEAGKVYSQIDTEIVERVDEQGNKEFVEVQKHQGLMVSGVRLDSDGFYNGKAKNYYIGTEQLKSEGYWTNGYWDGKWTFWDKQGQITHVAYYEIGKPLKYQALVNGTLTELPEVLWPNFFKNTTQSSPTKSKKFTKAK